MPAVERRTTIAHGRLALREFQLEAARTAAHGRQILTFEQCAARLAGGLVHPIDSTTLRAAVQAVLPDTPLSELDAIKSLPGFVQAAADTLWKAWRADIDLQARAHERPRLAAAARLEAAVVPALPPSAMRPRDLVAAAMERLDHADHMFGTIDIVGITELSPCWRPLLHAIAERTPVRWVAGPRPVPEWLDGGTVEILTEFAQSPTLLSVSAATLAHEVIEAFRWARQLVADGTAAPAEIGIAAVDTREYDDTLLALRADANLDVHFAHGVPVTASREGQAAAALADLLVRGLSQSRIRRLARLLARDPGPFQSLPPGWMAVLPTDAPLRTPDAWFRHLDRLEAGDWPQEQDGGQTLRSIVTTLARGLPRAAAIGEDLLHGRTRAIWRKALDIGPAAALDLTIEALRLDDATEPCTSITWMPASALAASPRPYARLLGLNASRWPRRVTDDRLLPDHIIPAAELDPLPTGLADRRDFATIRATTAGQLVFSHARRDRDGRPLGPSVLLPVDLQRAYLRRNRAPAHAFSETDRVTARPQEFRTTLQANSAGTCWRNWRKESITAHDGLVRPAHPVILAILQRTQSARSLRQLLRNPLGFVWTYGLQWRAPLVVLEALVLDGRTLGELVHTALERTLRTLPTDRDADPATITRATETAVCAVAAHWEATRPIPPRLIWHDTLAKVRTFCERGLAPRSAAARDLAAFAEVPFGGRQAETGAAMPWNPDEPVTIPIAGLRIQGTIDRLEIATDRSLALVFDYKTGKPPAKPLQLDGGRELQRCLYAYAVQAMLGPNIAVDAALHYLRDDTVLRLDDPASTLDALAGHLETAYASLLSGGSTLGIDAGDTYDELAFALPANAKDGYCRRKHAAAAARLGDAARVWEAP